VFRLSRIAVLALPAGCMLHAQVAASPNGQGASLSGNTAPSTVAAAKDHGTDLSLDTTRLDQSQGLRRDAMLGLADWDHTLLGAFQLGARLIRLSVTAPIYSGPAPDSVIARAHPQASTVVHFSASAPHAPLDEIAKALKIDQLQRQGMNVRLNSPFGNFRLTYREVFGGRANSLGGGVGQASAAATFTTPRFGTGGMFDFSAAALMGTGQINTFMGGGFGNNSIGGFGPGAHKQQAPTVALKLTF
jgi:hypothetical protein